jgi:putative membrane-bound dehydrogenase-like protein
LFFIIAQENHFMRSAIFALTFLVSLLGKHVIAQTPNAPKKLGEPIRALLVTGGCCHDYPRQKQILTKGVSARANVQWVVVHQGGTATNSQIPLYNDANWADGFDVVVHNECFADVKDPAWVARVLEPHRNGIPAVLIHCAMHCYRTGNDDWFEFCGVQSPGHGPHYAYTVDNKNATHPIMKGFGADWSVAKGELYHTIKLFPSTTVLATAKRNDTQEDQVCIWTNQYRNTRVFGTTIGHYNETMADPKYLDMLTRGILWSVYGDDMPEIQPAPNEVTTEIQAIARGEKDNLAKSDGKCCGEGNVLLGQKATASSEEVAKQNFANRAVDGDVRTRWCNNGGGGGAWLQIDLPQPTKVSSLRIHWEQEAAYSYRVEGTADGKEWKPLIEQKGNNKVQRIVSHTIDPTELTSLKVIFLGASTGVWGSIWEVEAYAGALPALPEGIANSNSSPARLGDIQAPSGFEVQLFAAPPEVNYPVCLTSGAQGELFVGIDEQGSLGREKGFGRVVKCVDRDGDGQAEDIRVFAKVDHPRGMVYDQGNLWVLHPPYLTLYRDEDLDGVADTSKVLIEGISTEAVNQRGADHTTNGIRMGIDGWIYIAVGDFGFSKAVGTDGRVLSRRGGGIVRVRPDGTEMEIYAWGLRNILDVCIDPDLEMFTRDNTNDGGGWNVRFSHILQGAEYGYPSRYINYPEETMPPLADYGGGSGCGGMFVDEPRWPSDFKRAAYTCDWGTSEVYVHRLQGERATFQPHQQTFLKIARPTDIEMDTSGRMYVSSWLNGGFSFSDKNVGFVALITPKDFVPKPFPLLTSASTSQLVQWLKRGGSAGIFHLSRELLRRGDQEDVSKLLLNVAADSSLELGTRTAALFTLKQILGKSANARIIELATHDPMIRRVALRCVTDRMEEIDAQCVEFAVASLAMDDPKVLSQAVISLRRCAMAKNMLSQEQRASLSADLLALPVCSQAWEVKSHAETQPERVIPHLVVQTLLALGSPESVVTGLNGSASHIADITLRQMHQTETVTALIQRLYRPATTALKLKLIEILARLYYREGDYTRGDWWGTRPDTSGPYYDRQIWEGSERIEKFLRGIIEQGDFDLRDHARKSAERFRLPLAKNTSAIASVNEPMKQEPIVIAEIDRNDASLVGNMDPAKVMALLANAAGNAEQGKSLFQTQACNACHTFADGQPPKGPHLVDIGKRYSRKELIESILKPNAKLAQGFDSWQFLTVDGDVITGFVVTESAESVVIRDGQGIMHELVQSQIEERKKQEKSMMPEGLVGNLKPEQLADLLAYLESLH